MLFRSLTDSVGEVSVGEVVAVDGKTLRRSYDRTSNKAALNKAALQMIDVWSCKQELVLGQRAAVPVTTNETGALPELLRLSELEGWSWKGRL